MFSVQCFALKSENQDEKIIETLLDDKIPIVELYAVLAAIKFGNPDSINLVINKMANLRRFNKAIHRNLFLNINPQNIHTIAQRLANEKDAYIRSVCYNLLILFAYKGNIDTSEDVNSSQVDLKIAAIKYLTFSDPEKAAFVASNLLNDASWQVRVIAIQTLLKLNSSNSINQIGPLLKDHSWGVRYNAAQALLQLGPQGREVLLAQNIEEDAFAYEIAQFTLNRDLNKISPGARSDDIN